MLSGTRRRRKRSSRPPPGSRALSLASPGRGPPALSPAVGVRLHPYLGPPCGLTRQPRPLPHRPRPRPRPRLLPRRLRSRWSHLPRPKRHLASRRTGLSRSRANAPVLQRPSLSPLSGSSPATLDNAAHRRRSTDSPPPILTGHHHATNSRPSHLESALYSRIPENDGSATSCHHVTFDPFVLL